MSTAGSRIALCIALLSAGASAAIELPSDAPPALQGISDCVRANAPGRTVRQTIELSTVDRLGDDHRTTITSERKRTERGLSRIVLRATAPEDLRGNAFLLLEQQGRSPDLFRYAPGQQHVSSLEGKDIGGSLFRSDFTYEDVRRIQNLARSKSSRLLTETEVDGRVAWQIETAPEPEAGSVYTRIVSAVDKERCVPLRVEFYTGGQEPTKLLLVPAAKVKRYSDGWLPMELTMRDLPGNSRSRMVVTSVELDVEIPDRSFTRSALRLAP